MGSSRRTVAPDLARPAVARPGADRPGADRPGAAAAAGSPPPAAPGDDGRGALAAAAAVVAQVPSLVVVAVAVVVGVGTASSLLGWRPFGSQAASLGVVAVLLAISVVLVRTALLEGERRPPWLVLVPAAYLLLVGAVLALGPGDALGWFLGGDHVRHVIFTANLQAAGNLDYGVEGYPRGWHSLVATFWSASGAHLDGPGVGRLVALQATLAWTLPALVSAETGLLGAALARRSGLPDRAAALAGLVAASGICLPTVLANYQSLGFETSWLAALVLATSARAVLSPAVGLRPVVLCAAGVVTMSHTWQLVLPGAGLALVATTVTAARHGRRRRWLLVAAWLVAALASLPGLLGVLAHVGLRHAEDADVDVPIPVITLVAALVAAGLLLVVPRRRPGRLAVVVAMVLLPGLTALALALRLHIPVSDYYPSKLVWHTVVLGLPAIGVVVAGGVGWLQGRGRPVTGVGRVLAGVVGALAVVMLGLTPVGAVAGAWSTGDGRLIGRALTTDGAGRAQVAWLGSVGDDTITRVLLDVYHPGRPLGPQQPLGVAGECELLRAAARPTVLTDRSLAEVRARYACLPEVEVVRVTASP